MGHSHNIRILFCIVISLFCLPFRSYTQADDAKLRAFAKQIEMSIESRNPYYFNLSFNPQPIFESLSINSYDNTDTAFLNGFIDGIKSSLELGTLIINELGLHGTFRYISNYTNNEEDWIVFRLLTESGINYHAYKVEQTDNDFKITDGYFFLSGDKLSETINLVFNRNVSMLISIPTMDAQLVESFNTLDEIESQYIKGKVNKAYAMFQKLPADHRALKSFQYAQLVIAGGMSDEIFLSAFNEYSSLYPREKGKYLIPLDQLVNHHQYEIALKCLDTLETEIVSDPIIDFFRGKIYFLQNDLENAKLYLSKVIDVDPEFQMGYLSLLNIYLTERNFEEATNLLDQMVYNFNTYKEDLSPFLSDFPDYLNSAVYKEWLEQ